MAGALPVALVTRRADALGSAWIAGEAETMRALAEAVLPSELGVAGAARVAREFREWIDGYRPNAELVHGYGTSALRFSRASPKARWAVQLERIGSRRSAVGSQPFVGMTVEERRIVVRDELKSERLDRLPAAASATHVAVALLSYYYGSSMAADLCHNARIGRATCRTLASSPHKPLPLAGVPQ
ncbi:MAG: hypothetical protein AABZ80_06140 [Gemmatimonadota bacterium]